MELVDVTDSKSVGSDTVWVRVPPPAPKEGDRPSLSPSFGALPFCQYKRGRCGGLIEIVQENLDGFPAHTLSLSFPEFCR